MGRYPPIAVPRTRWVSKPEHQDIVRHKYWATKLFGYSQAIALQR